MALTLPGISSTGTLSAAGVGSGLDVKGLVSQLMAVEQQPLATLSKQEATYQAQLSSLGSIKGALSALQSAAQSLSSASTASYSATVSDNTVLTATGSSSAIAGNYSVTVDELKLAQNQKLVAEGRSSTSTGIGSNRASSTLKIELGTNLVSGDPAETTDFTVSSSKTLTIDSSNNTLAGIRNAINAAGAGVTASIINDGSDTPYRLALTSNTTGKASSMRLSVTGDTDIATLLSYDPTALVQNFSEKQTARDAEFTVDGVAISSHTNTVTDAIPGVTLNLAGKAGSVTVAVQRSSSSLNSALGALVSAYNGANSAISSLTAKGAVMQGEGSVVNLQRQMRIMLGSLQHTGGAYSSLSQLGISFQLDGSLKLDAAKLGSALSSNLVDVSSLASAIGTALKSAADSMLGTAGPITSKTVSINRSITEIGSRRTRLQDRLAATEARYLKQFSALDTLISSMNSTSTYLTQQLANLPGVYSNNKG